MSRIVSLSLVWLLFVSGLAGLAAVGYRVLDLGAGHRQQAIQSALSRSWAPPPVLGSPPVLGAPPLPVPVFSGHPRPSQPFAMMTVSRWHGWRFAVVEGTGEAQLALGPGHVAGTSWPGGANFAVAAHVITAGNPFMHLSGLKVGDLVRIQTGDGTFTYRVSAPPFRVNEHDVSVLNAVPGQHKITLITCWPITLNSTPWRTIVYGTLVSAGSE
jgi:LPXTG-site transpeptidase (sortase) family protein